MKHFTRTRFITSVVILLASAGGRCFAEEAERALELPAIFADGMVLQRGESVPVWGWTDAGAEVTVEFNGQKKIATADKDGKWQVRLDAMKALKTGRKMVIVCGEQSKTITDVLIGEVWFCSGQSNMTVWLGFLAETPVKEERYQPIVDYIKREIETANDPLLRQFQAGIGTGPFEELDRGEGSWISAATPKDTSRITGTGYFFGRELRERLDVPVALIKCDYGGTLIEPWIPISGHRRFPTLWTRYEDHLQSLKKQCEEWDSGETQKKNEAALEKWEAEGKQGRKPFQFGDPRNGPQNRATLFNGMVHPWIPYGIKGVIWYQGESNSGANAAEYAVSFEAMVRGWRAYWDKPGLPFYMAQLASFEKKGEGRMWLTEAQRLAITKIAHTGLAVLNDVGETLDVHPKNKIDVGRRLARWALKQDYGIDLPAWSGPLYRDHDIRDDHIVVRFDHAGSGLMVGRKALLAEAVEVDEPLPHFELCRFLGDWQPAEAAIIGNGQVKVWSEAVPQPKWVRYAWQADLDGTMLYNREGLPASIFTTEPNFKDLAMRSADRAAFFMNLKQVYGIASATGSSNLPDELPGNIALKAKVTASSVFENESASFAVDGDPKTGWASNKDAKKAHLLISLGNTYRITHVGYQSRLGVFERVQSFKIDTGEGQVQMCYLDEEKPTDFQVFDIEDVETDVLRWSVLDARYGGNTGAMEIAVYGEPKD